MAGTVRRDFDSAARAWDEQPVRVELAKAVASAIVEQVRPEPTAEAMDYGCGTGLVTLEVLPHVGSIVAADSSQGMLSVLDEKLKAQGITNVRTQLVDPETGQLPALALDLIFSSMTMHHVDDPGKLIRRFFDLMRPGGALAIADLDPDDGEFHGDNTGVLHFGFSREYMMHLFRDAGFENVGSSTAHTIRKDVAGKGPRDFTVFLVTGRKSV